MPVNMKSNKHQRQHKGLVFNLCSELYKFVHCRKWWLWSPDLMLWLYPDYKFVPLQLCLPIPKKNIRAATVLFKIQFCPAGRIVAFNLFLLILLASCSHKKTGDNKKVFHLNISTGYLESLDPADAKDLNMMWIDHMVYNTLVETDEQLHTQPSLARSWEVNANGLVYTFHLRNDVFFHNNPQFPDGKGRR